MSGRCVQTDRLTALSCSELNSRVGNLQLEISALLRCYSAQIASFLQTFRDKL